jgi:hypothetical protein
MGKDVRAGKAKGPSPLTPSPLIQILDAGWSSPVARQAHNLKVTGSNPVPATNNPRNPRARKRRGLSFVRNLPHRGPACGQDRFAARRPARDHRPVATASRSRSSNKSHPRDLGMLAVCLGHQAVEFLRVGAGELGATSSGVSRLCLTAFKIRPRSPSCLSIARSCRVLSRVVRRRNSVPD